MKKLILSTLLLAIAGCSSYSMTDASLESDAMIAATTKADEIKIASWNIAWLGSHEYNQRSEADYQQLALYAKQLDADVIALQEVENEEWARKVLGDDYNYYFSTKDWVQRVGVAVKKSQGFSIKGKDYKELDIGKVRYGMDITLTRDGKKLRLLAVHLKSGCFTAPLDNTSIAEMPNTNDKEVRRKEACTKLSKQIKPLEQWIDSRAAEDTAFIVLGDFNRRFSQDIALKRSEDNGLWQALNDEGQAALWTPTTTRNSDCWGGYYKDYIDHIIFSPKAKAKYIDNSFSQLVFKEKYTRELSQNLSDHCPISVKLKL